VRERRLGSRYVLVEILGRGAMGQVYRARVESPRIGQDAPSGAEPDVAVKLLRDELGGDPDLVHRFLTEGRLLKIVDHPNVVRILDLVAEGDQLAIVMDLLPDGDLRRAVTIPCGESEAARILAGIADGLAAVHAADITHRDLKPENVLVERDQDGAIRPRISDFGVSRFSSATITNTRGMTGTVGYIAPEVAEGGPATPASDVYSLGVILYELCSGRGPFQAENPIALVRAHAQDPVTRPPGMSDPMWELTEVLLSKDPSRRPASGEVAVRARLLAAELPAEATPSPTGLPTAAPPTTGLPPTSLPTTVSPSAPPTVHLTPTPRALPPSPSPQSPPPSPGVTIPGPVQPYPSRAFPPSAPSRNTSGRRPVAYAAAGIAAVLLLTGVSWALWSPGSGGNTTVVGWADPVDGGTPPGDATAPASSRRVAGASSTTSGTPSAPTTRTQTSGDRRSPRTTTHTTSPRASASSSSLTPPGTTSTIAVPETSASTSTTSAEPTSSSKKATTTDPRAGTVAAPATQAGTTIKRGCPAGAVCMYTESGWGADSPQHVWTSYNTYTLSNEWGTRYIFNNQYATSSGRAGAYACETKSSCSISIAMDTYQKVDIGPINFIKVTSNGG
jgi:serine/threonine protein kinase